MAKLDPENPELAETEAMLRAQGPKVEYAFEDVKFANFTNVQPTSAFRFPAAMAVVAGDYDVYVVVKESGGRDEGQEGAAEGRRPQGGCDGSRTTGPTNSRRVRSS